MRSTRFIPVGLAAAVMVAPGGAVAFDEPDHLAPRPTLEVSGAVAVRSAAHVQARVPAAMTARWSRFRSDVGGQWHSTWDRGTSVVSRIYGSGVSVPGAIADAELAARHAREFLGRHIDLLAPGSSVSDFRLASNVLESGMRTIGFVQHYRGVPVVGGQVSFRYKNDRLFVIGSEALPDVQVSAHVDDSAALAGIDAANLISASRATHVARSWLERDATGRVVQTRSVSAPAILPLVGHSRVIGYRLVRAVVSDSEQPVGRWRVYVEASTGAPVAREQLLRFASGTVLFNTPIRQPLDQRSDFPAPALAVTPDGEEATTTDGTGAITWPGDAGTTLTLLSAGPLVQVNNIAGDNATVDLAIEPDGTALWSAADDEHLDAQLTTFIHAGIVKEFSRGLNPDLAWLDLPLEANVNISETCNAFSDGESINFFVASSQCANTGRLPDVIYHEFGHSLHAQSIIDGVGSFDGAFSEGLSDYLSATITGDPAMGRGFFKSDDPLRHIDPPDREHIWPDDVGGAHYTGLIFAGAMWDLRKLLIDHFGAEEGVVISDRLFYSAVRRAAGIPTTYVEVLAADDDDGNLANGSPNVCDINAAFGAHGLRSVSADVTALSVESPEQEGYQVALNVTGLYAQCPGDSVADAAITWTLRGDETVGGEIIMETGEGGFVGTIPAVADGSVVRYQVNVRFNDGTELTYPDNPADSYFEFYVGEVVELYCTDFEANPFAEGWTHGLSQGQPGEGADDWMWGEPLAGPASGDPRSAHSGQRVLGNDLGGGEFNGFYQPDKVNYAESPAIDFGDYSDVRLHYWRWLNVEDGFFDQASIYASGELVWQNFNSDNGNASAVHHQDHEWRFHDVPLSAAVGDGPVAIRFEISSDGGLELGGWTVDDLCVVANVASICGDGETSAAEECDDGADNSDTEPDACRETCRVPVCGDGVIDSGEHCDDGNNNDADDCPADCGDPDQGLAGCGCRSVGDGTEGAGLLLLVLATGALLRRRRFRACRGSQ